jgi:hypothetical protein
LHRGSFRLDEAARSTWFFRRLDELLDLNDFIDYLVQRI